jgi:hypothetical protein
LLRIGAHEWRKGPVCFADKRCPRQSEDRSLADALGLDIKGKISPVLCPVGVELAFVKPGLACAAYLLLALIWFVPDRRIEKVIAGS